MSDSRMWERWGVKRASVNLGKIDRRECPNCRKEQNFVASMKHRYYELLFWPFFSWGTKYYYRCQVCKHGFEVERDEPKPYPTKNPKPWLHRFGWTIPAGILFVSWLVYYLDR